MPIAPTITDKGPDANAAGATATIATLWALKPDLKLAAKSGAARHRNVARLRLRPVIYTPAPVFPCPAVVHYWRKLHT
jgi:hypothetical protein